MTKVHDLHIKWTKKKEYCAVYKEFAPEVTAAWAAIKASADESDGALSSSAES